MKARAYWPLDEAPATKGDARFLALNMREDPASLPAGFYSLGENVRVEGGRVVPRKGVRKLPWSNRDNMPADERIVPYGMVWGLGKFLDPDGLSWMLIAADDTIYRTRPQNQVQSMVLPAGVTVATPAQFIQAFDVSMLLRDEERPLYLTSIDEAWQEVAQAALWDPAATYIYGNEILFGDASNAALGYLDRAVTSATLASLVVTVVMVAAHGFTTRQTISIRGAAQAYFNGRFVITKLDDTRFTYKTDTGADGAASGTLFAAPDDAVHRAISTTSAGDNPRTAPSKWTPTATLDPIPNSRFGLFAQNRVFLIHDRDLVAASDVLDYVHYLAQLQDLRINTGNSDKLIAIVKFNETSVVCFKERSIHVVWNVYGDLSQIRLDEVTREFGLAGPKAFTRVGNQLWFLASDGAIRALFQTAEQKLMVGRRRLSDPIQPIMDRLAWSQATKVAAATWDGRVYFAVPLDSGQRVDPDILDYSSYPPSGVVTVEVKVGHTYRWTPGAWEQSLLIGSTRAVTLTRTGDVATATSVAHGFNSGDQVTIGGAVETSYNGTHEVIVTGPDQFTFAVYGAPATPATGTVTAWLTREYFTSAAEFTATQRWLTIRGTPYRVRSNQLEPILQGNNAVLVGRAITKDWNEDRPGSEFDNDVWESLDIGESIHISDWLTFPYEGRERLFCASLDGYIQLYEEDWADTDFDPYYDTPPPSLSSSVTSSSWSSSSSSQTWRQAVREVYPSVRFLSRGYQGDEPGLKRSLELRLHIETWNPLYTATLFTDGPAETQVIVNGRTRNRARFTRPWDRPAYDERNSADDGRDPWREDYSVLLPAAGVLLESGLAVGLHQAYTESIRASLRGRFFQVQIAVAQGRVEILGVELDAIPHGRNRKSHT